jgi:hypothetical protein
MNLCIAIADVLRLKLPKFVPAILTRLETRTQSNNLRAASNFFDMIVVSYGVLEFTVLLGRVGAAEPERGHSPFPDAFASEYPALRSSC